MNKKRGYFIHGSDPSGGFAVVATSLQEARRIVYRAGDIEGDWIDITGHWCRDAKVDNLPIGVVEDLRLGLVRGMYQYIEDFECDVCGEVSFVHECNGKVLCASCEEEKNRSEVEINE